MFKGSAKGIRTTMNYEHSGKGVKKGLFPGVNKGSNAGNRAFVIAREKVFTFYTNFSGAFSIVITKAVGKVCVWDFGDGSALLQSNTGTVTYANSSIKKVRIYVDDMRLITNFSTALVDMGIVGTIDFRQLVNCVQFGVGNNIGITKILLPKSTVTISAITFAALNIANGLDMRPLGGVSGSIQIITNPLLTYVNFAPSTASITLLQLQTNNLTGILDLSMLPGIGGQLRLNQNPKLLGVIFASTSTGTTFTTFLGNNSGFVGVIDVSVFTNLGGQFTWNTNPGITGFIFPTTANSITIFNVNACNITGVFDVSTLTGISTTFNCGSNPLLTSVILPTNLNTILTFTASGCTITTINFLSMSKLTEVNNCVITVANNALTAANLNQMLIDLDTNATNGFTGRTITAGGTNAAPTGLGLVAKTSLIAKGFSVATN